jgi:hypothetical protein
MNNSEYSCMILWEMYNEGLFAMEKFKTHWKLFTHIIRNFLHGYASSKLIWNILYKNNHKITINI